MRRTDSRGRPYWVEIEWGVNKGVLRATRLAVRSPDGVDATMVRDVRVAAEIADARERWLKLNETAIEWPELSEEAKRRTAELIEAGRRRSPRDDLDLLELIATTYRTAIAAGRPPAKAVHDELERRKAGLSRGQVGKLIMRCREVGLLGPADGRRGGERIEQKRGKR